jgi:copper chaperone CopZ
MKKFALLTLMVFGMLAFAFGKADSTATFKVYGNCESCKARIEKAAKAAGAVKADWSEETKLLEVSFDAAKTNSDKIQQKIAAVGHDTEKYQSLQNAYNKLPGCCKYEREAVGVEKH